MRFLTDPVTGHKRLGRFGWKAVRGGSRTYVDELLTRIGGRARIGLGVRALRRDLGGVELTTDDGTAHRFDKVVVAAHADQALALLADPSDGEPCDPDLNPALDAKRPLACARAFFIADASERFLGIAAAVLLF